jgi:hypothetical protein
MSDPRLIDANALKADVLELVDYRLDKEWDTSGVLLRIDAAPTIAAVQVVFCKNCTLRGTCDCPPWYANEWGIGQDVPGDNDFCSRGERRRG